MGPDSAPIEPWRLAQLLIDNEKRGIDATGVAVQYTNGQLRMIKSADPAWRFLAHEKWREFEQSIDWSKVWAVLGHTRAWTVGMPSDNDNNHPVVAGKTMMVHNGGITNHEWLYRELKLERPATVDSAIIAAILEEYGFTQEGVKALNRMNGHAAIAAVSADYPGSLFLARSGSPLELGFWEDKQQMLFSSRTEGIHLASRQYFKKYGVTFQRAGKVELSPVKTGVAMLFSRDAQGRLDQNWTAEFNSAGHMVHRVTYACHERYAGKQQGLEHVKNLVTKESEKPRENTERTATPIRVICPKTTCLTVNIVPAGALIEDYECSECSTALIKPSKKG